ncbi:hypothetical protein GCM10007209_30950 [Haloferax sulfurifontis]|uniref:Uncharacterized protein n=1 Tax=Haloferax sulfurifontis TaxID=255616 RepID=A0A830E9N8_9EURY|nr:hypothetical protein GCM10007209_30950 [Haloferax sulfurifontis]
MQSSLRSVDERDDGVGEFLGGVFLKVVSGVGEPNVGLATGRWKQVAEFVPRVVSNRVAVRKEDKRRLPPLAQGVAGGGGQRRAVTAPATRDEVRPQAPAFSESLR